MGQGLHRQPGVGMPAPGPGPTASLLFAAAGAGAGGGRQGLAPLLLHACWGRQVGRQPGWAGTCVVCIWLCRLQQKRHGMHLPPTPPSCHQGRPAPPPMAGRACRRRHAVPARRAGAAWRPSRRQGAEQGGGAGPIRAAHALLPFLPPGAPLPGTWRACFPGCPCFGAARSLDAPSFHHSQALGAVRATRHLLQTGSTASLAAALALALAPPAPGPLGRPRSLALALAAAALVAAAGEQAAAGFEQRFVQGSYNHSER